MIEITNLTKKYGKFEVLKSIDLKIANNQIVSLMGPNGSGKTTLIKSILGLVIPDRGTILVNGINTKADFIYRKAIGYMPQTAYFPDNLKVSEVIQIIKGIRKDEVEYDMELYEMLNIEYFSGKKISALSQGMKQKVSCAITFLFNPAILILDEPTAGLDPISAEILKNKILKESEKGKLIIFTTHILNEVKELSDRMIFLLDGEILFEKIIERMPSGFESKIIFNELRDLKKYYER